MRPPKEPQKNAVSLRILHLAQSLYFWWVYQGWLILRHSKDGIRVSFLKKWNWWDPSKNRLMFDKSELHHNSKTVIKLSQSLKSSRHWTLSSFYVSTRRTPKMQWSWESDLKLSPDIFGLFANDKYHWDILNIASWLHC